MGTRLPGRGLRTTAAVVALVLVGACGDPNQLGAGAPTSTESAAIDASSTTTERVAVPPGGATSPGSSPPVALTSPVATTTTTVPSATSTTLDPMPELPELPDLPAGSEVLERGASWCPPMRLATAADVADLAEREATVTAATADAGAYIAEQADDAAEPWLDLAADPPRLVAGFRRNVGRHRAALARVADVRHLLVCQTSHSIDELLAWTEEVRRILGSMRGGPVVAAVGDGGDRIGFTVRADRADLAQQVYERYGDAVTIRLGLLTYPPTAASASTLCPWAVAAGPRNVGGLRATVTLASPTVRSGGELDARVRVTNTGSERARFYADSTLHGYVVRPGTTEVIGVSSRYPALAGSGGDLAPGESKEFDALLGTTSCDPALGPVLPPGTYEVLVPVDPSPMGSTDANNLVSEPVTVVVTA